MPKGNVARRSASLAAGAVLGLSATLLSPAPAQAAETRDCGFSDDYIAAITTEYDDSGNFTVHVTPTALGRVVGTADFQDGTQKITNEYWHAVQACVPNLYGSLADSIYQQLQCHVWGGVVAAATGPTYDLESTHLALAYPGLWTYRSTHCLNVDGEWRVVPENAGLA